MTALVPAEKICKECKTSQRFMGLDEEKQVEVHHCDCRELYKEVPMVTGPRGDS